MNYNLRLLKEIFFPRCCGVCQKQIDNGYFCSSCRPNFSLDKLESYGSNRESYQELVSIGQPLVVQDVLKEVLLLYKYDAELKQALHSLKFEAKAELLPLLMEEAKLGAAPYVQQLQRSYDMLLSIPTSEARKQRRGFDVPSALFEFLPIEQDVIKRVKTTAPLYELNKEQRQVELGGCFALIKPKAVRNKRILLVDDIFTTGSTLMEAGQLLLQAGAKSVSALCFCGARAWY